MTKLRILLLNAQDMYGGGEFFVFQLGILLKRKGHEVWASCREDNPLFAKCMEAGIDVLPTDYPSGSGNGKLRKNIRLLKNFIEEKEVEIVHSNTNYDRTAGALAAAAAGVHHVTSNHSFHSIEHNPTHWFRNKFLTHHFIVDGEHTRELLIKKDRIRPEVISTVYPGIEPESMQLNREMRSAVRTEFGLKDSDVLIGNVGRMVEMKGQEYLIRAFLSIAEKFPQARLMIVGSGKLEEHLKNLSARGLAPLSDFEPNSTTTGQATLHSDSVKRIIFPGFRSDLQAIYSAFDIYVQPSLEGGGESFPFTVLYALARGIPIIVTRVGDMPVMSDSNGFVVPDKNPLAIGEKLCILLSNPGLREEMGRNGKAHLRRNFTAEKMSDSIEQIYYDVLAQ